MKHESMDTDQPAESGGLDAPSLKLIALLIVVIAVAVFFFQNGEGADIGFLWIDVNWPVRSVIVISVIAGVILDQLFSWQWRRARRRKSRSSTQ